FAKALVSLLMKWCTSVDEAGADTQVLAALRELDQSNRLLIPVYAMLSARDTALINKWRTQEPGPAAQRLTIRAVKAFYDGAMGSRGAYFLEPYSDKPDTSGIGGAGYGFDRELLAAMMRAGFQVAVHAIGDRAKRETLGFFTACVAASPTARETRPRIEPAQG